MKAETTHPTEAHASQMLGALAGLSARCDATDKSLDNGASERLGEVEKRMEELRPQVLVSAAAADEYQSLQIERYRLHSVVMASSPSSLPR